MYYYNCSPQFLKFATDDYWNYRDWLTSISNPYSMGSDNFAIKLGYTIGDEPQYNGNISEMHWKTGGFNPIARICNPCE